MTCHIISYCCYTTFTSLQGTSIIPIPYDLEVGDDTTSYALLGQTPILINTLTISNLSQTSINATIHPTNHRVTPPTNAHPPQCAERYSGIHTSSFSLHHTVAQHCYTQSPPTDHTKCPHQITQSVLATMSQSSASSDSPKPTKRSRTCATDEPFNASATPYTAASAAYVSLFSSQAGLALRNQGAVAPPPLSGALASIVYDNCRPYNFNNKTVLHIEPRVRIQRTRYGAAEPVFDINPVPHIQTDTNPTDQRPILINILEYHCHISQYGDFSNVPLDLQIPALISNTIINHLGGQDTQLFTDAIKGSSAWKNEVHRRNLLDEAFRYTLTRKHSAGRLIRTISPDQLDGLGWEILFILNEKYSNLEPADIA